MLSFPVRHPWIALALMLGLVLAAAPGLARLGLQTDGRALVPRDDPAVVIDASIRDHFDLRDPIVLVFHTSHPDGIYNAETLRAVGELSQALAALEGVGPDHVMSLATERRDRVLPGTLRFTTFLEPPPTTPELLELVRSDIAAIGLLEGTLVSHDARATAILVGVPPGDTEDRIALYRAVAALGERHRAPADRLAVVGAPVAEALLGQHLLDDLQLLLPLSFSLVAFVVWLGCRRAWGVALALIEVAAALVFTFGVMGWAGVPVSLPIAVMPVILATIGIADEIHVFWHYQRVLARPERPAHPAPVLETMRRMVRPIVLAALTTAIGFLSFPTSSIGPVRAFGLFTGLGVVFCSVWSLVAIPASLTLLGPQRLARPPGARLFLPALLGGIERAIARPALTLPAIGLVSAVAVAGVWRLEVQDSWIGGFARDSPFRLATDEVNAAFFGTHLLLVHVELPARGQPLLEPDVVRSIGQLEEFLRARPEVGGVLGPRDHVAAMNYLLSGRTEGTRGVPPDAQTMGHLISYFDRVRGARRRREILDDELRRSIVTVFLEEANYRETATVMQAVQTYADQHLAPLGARVEFAGDVAVSQAMIPAIVRTQVLSLAVALACASIAISVMLRSVRRGVLAVLPATLAALWIFGAMGWLGIPLGVATSMFCAISLGIGVDYAIHLLEGIRRARAAAEPAPVAHAVAEVGPAIVVDAAAVALGFGLLGLSRVPANARLGLLVALVLAVACVLTLVGLGALLGSGKKEHS